ncbi:MAG: tetratricopeptide repeat protein [Candidatus Auribacterota bacterium]
MKLDVWKVLLFFTTILLAAYRIYPSHMEIASLLERSGKYTMALEEYNNAIDQDGRKEALANIAQLNELLGSVDTTLALYEQITASKPYDYNAHKNLSRLYQWNSMPDKSLAEYERFAEVLEHNIDCMPEAEKYLLELYTKIRALYSAHGGRAWLKIAAITEKMKVLDKNNPAYYIDLIDIYLRLKNGERAIEIANLAFAKFNDSIDVLEKAGWCAVCTSQNDMAQTVYTRLIELDNTNPEYWYNIFAVTQRLNAIPDIKSFHNHILTHCPKIPDLYLSCARLYQKLKFNKYALDMYERLLAMNPGDKSILEEYAFLNIAEGDTDTALQALIEYERLYGMDMAIIEQMLGIYLERKDYSQAQKQIDRLIAQFPSKRELLALKANIYEWDNDPANAASAYEQLLVHEPENEALAQTIIELYAWSGNTERALYYIENMITANPDNEKLRVQALDLYYAQIDTPRIELTVRELYRINPNSPRYIREMASLFAQKLLYMDAFLLYEELDDGSAEDTALLEQLAWLSETLGFKTESLRYYQRLYESGSRSPAVMESIVRLLIERKDYRNAISFSEQLNGSVSDAMELSITEAMIELGQYEDAEAVLNRLLGRDASVPALSMLGSLLYTKKDYDRAISVYEQIHAKQPRNTDIILTLASLYLDRKEYGTAIEYYTDYLKIKPDDTEIAYTIASLYEAVGDTGKMRAWLYKVMDVFFKEPIPNPKHFAMRARTLQKLNNIPAAISYYQQALHSDGSLDLWRDYIDCLVSHNLIHRAENAISAAPDDVRNDRLVMRTLAQIYTELENYNAALAIYDKLHAQYPDDPDILADMAYVFLRKGRWDKSLKMYQDILRTTDKQWARRKEIEDETESLIKEYAPSLRTGLLLIKEIKKNTQVYSSQSSIYLRHDLALRAGMAKYYFYDRDNPVLPPVHEHLTESTVELNWLVHKYFSINIGPISINHGPEDIYTVNAGVTYDNRTDFRCDLNLSWHDKLLDTRQAVVYGGKTDHIDLGMNWQVNDALSLMAEGIYSKYIFADSVKREGLSTRPGSRTQLALGADLKLLSDPLVALTYRYFWADSRTDRDYNILLFSMDSKVRTHQFGVRAEKQVNENFSCYGTAFVGNDDERDMFIDNASLFGYEVGAKWHVINNLELVGSYQLLYENGDNAPAARAQYISAYGIISF